MSGPSVIASGAPSVPTVAPTFHASGLRAVGDGQDLEPVVVENDLFGAGLAVDVEERGAGDPPGVEIDIEIERHMINPRFERPGKAVDVLGVGRGKDRRDLRRVGGNRGRAARSATLHEAVSTTAAKSLLERQIS